MEKDVYIQPPDRLKQSTDDVQTYASFGDDGTTVSVNKYGHIMQISRFLGFGLSGFLCVDSRYDNPYFVQSRMEDLTESMKHPERGLRLDLVDLNELQDEPSMGFMYDRWPRYVFEKRLPHTSDERPNVRVRDNVDATRESDLASGKPKASPLTTQATPSVTAEPDESLSDEIQFLLSIQYFCSKGTVFQKYLINIGKGGIPRNARLSLDPYICIRSLDFVNDLYFNDDRAKLKTSVVSNNLVVTHVIEKDEMEELEEWQPAELKGQLPIAAALVISPFIGDQPAQIKTDTTAGTDEACHYIDLTDSLVMTRLEITVAYTLKLIHRDTMEATVSSESGETTSNGTAPLQDEHISASDKQASEPDTTVLVEAGPTGPCDPPAQDATTTTEEGDLAAEEEALVKRCIVKITAAKEEMEHAFRGDSSYRKIFFSPSPSLDFAFRRNLNHILYVCCIPISAGCDVGNTSEDPPAIAITCGDIAGHRVGPRASL